MSDGTVLDPVIIPEKPACEHQYGEWNTVVDATCTKMGLQLRLCSACDHTELALLDKSGHEYHNGVCRTCGIKHENLLRYRGKVISVLGDSTSTFEGYTPINDGFNLNHRDRYPQSNLLTDVNETWWMQVINKLDAKLGINDSWAGSTVYWGDNLQQSDSDNGEKAAMASLTRIQNLGSNGTPDVILFYGAGNDIRRTAKLGSFDPATAPTEADLTATKWETFADAYVAAIMRLQYYYPQSQILVILYEENSAIWTDEKLNAYNSVIQAICDHYGVVTLDLRGRGFRPDMFPDQAHPNAEGMSLIANAVLQTLLNEFDITAGENKVYKVSHDLQDAKATLHYWKGVSAGAAYYEILSGSNLHVNVCMGGVDITDSVYADGVIAISEVTGDLEIRAVSDGGLAEHLQQLPDAFCSGVNIWTSLIPENIYYTVDGWGLFDNAPNVHSVTFSVKEGDRIWASSFGYLPENGNGTRVTWFDANGVLKSVDRNTVYTEFSRYGYITAPQGAIALNVPMPSSDQKYEIFILNKSHEDMDGTCSICGQDVSAGNDDGLSEHLQPLPDELCAGVNIWTSLTPENMYYTVDGWGNLATNAAYSVTFPVQSGDRIWASSLGYLPENGNGTRVTWFDSEGVLLSVPRDQIYNEFTANGYITAPENAVALNVPMPSADEKYEIYILNRAHDDQDGTCGICGRGFYKSMTYVTFGDSITYGIDGTKDNWGLMPEPYPVLVGKLLEVGEVKNKAISGATLCANSGHTNMTEKILAFRDHADIISVMLGVNDYQTNMPLGNWDSKDNTTVYGSLFMIAQHLTEQYPDALVFFITPFPTVRAGGNGATGQYNVADVAEAVKYVAAMYDIPVLDLYTIGQYENEMVLPTNDGIHPSQEHFRTYTAPQIAAFIEACYTDDTAVQTERLEYSNIAKTGYVPNNGNIVTQSKHFYCEISAEGLEKIIIEPPIASEYNPNNYHYVVYVSEDGSVSFYAPLNKKTPTVIEFDSDAKGTVYLNSFTDELNYVYVKNATVIRRESVG